MADSANTPQKPVGPVAATNFPRMPVQAAAPMPPRSPVQGVAPTRIPAPPVMSQRPVAPKFAPLTPVGAVGSPVVRTVPLASPVAPAVPPKGGIEQPSQPRRDPVVAQPVSPIPVQAFAPMGSPVARPAPVTPFRPPVQTAIPARPAMAPVASPVVSPVPIPFSLASPVAPVVSAAGGIAQPRRDPVAAVPPIEPAAPTVAQQSQPAAQPDPEKATVNAQPAPFTAQAGIRRDPVVVINPERVVAPTENPYERARRNASSRLSERRTSDVSQVTDVEPRLDPLTPNRALQSAVLYDLEARLDASKNSDSVPKTAGQALVDAFESSVDVFKVYQPDLPVTGVEPRFPSDSSHEVKAAPTDLIQAAQNEFIDALEELVDGGLIDAPLPDVLSALPAILAAAPSVPAPPSPSPNIFKSEMTTPAPMTNQPQVSNFDRDGQNNEVAAPVIAKPPVAFAPVQPRPLAAPAVASPAFAVPGTLSPLRPLLSGAMSLDAMMASMSASSQDDDDSYSSDGYDDSDRGDSDDGGGRAVASPKKDEGEEIEGLLSSVTEYPSWARGTIRTEDRKDMTVKGEVLKGLKKGLEYSFKGRLTHHSTHGDGFNVTSAKIIISPNDQAIVRFMSKYYDGIGPARATKHLIELRKNGGNEAVDALRVKMVSRPWDAELIESLKVLSSKVSFAGNANPEAQAAFEREQVSREISTRISIPGLREKTIKDLADHLIYDYKKSLIKAKKEARQTQTESDEFDEDEDDKIQVNLDELINGTWAALMLNPYDPIKEVSGYSFATAEKIAAIASVPPNSPLRLSALVEYAVEKGCQGSGHTFLREKGFIAAIKKIDETAPAKDALSYAIQEGLVIVDDQCVYTHKLHTAEKSVAKKLAKLLQPATPLTPRSFEEVKRYLTKNPGKINPIFEKGFDEDQIKAVAGMLLTPQRLHVLTGGPGTGKTAIMEIMLKMLKGRTFLFCAPTGMSAKVLTGRIMKHGHGASTICSMLQGSEESGFNINLEKQLECDILVVDESTMNGIGTADGLLSALPAHAHIIILGDPGLPATADKPGRAGQLPSISPGRFMQDLLLLPGVHHEHLTKTYRNSGGILDVVNEIAEGRINCVDRASVRFSNGLPPASVGFPAVMKEYLDSVQKVGIEKTYLVIPMRKGDQNTPGWNSTYANNVLRNACNPGAEKLPGTTLYLGDRIVIREGLKIKQPKPNDMGAIKEWTKIGTSDAKKSSLMDEFCDGIRSNYREPDEDSDIEIISVVNGDRGTIVAYAMPGTNSRLGSPQWIRLRLDDGRTVEFPGEEISSLQHSYAGTVHGAQGSEFARVIVVMTLGRPEFTNQTLLLTATSRGSDYLAVYADDAALKQIARTPMPPRNSRLVERVMDEMEKLENTEAEQDFSAEESLEDSEESMAGIEE